MAKQSALKVPTGLSPEKQAKVDAILKKYEEQNRQIEREHAKEMAKLYGGAALQIGSAFIPGTLGLKLAGGAIKGLTPIVGRKIAQNVATGVTSGLASGAVEGLGRGLMENQNPLKTMATDSLAGGLLGGLGGYGLGKVAQKLNTQTAWHGSPYKFDKFDNAYIGTGEGAQAHGYGHYAAKNKNVAQNRYAIDRIEYKNLPEDINRRTEVIGVENTKKELRDLQKHYENLMGQEGWGAGARKDFINKLSEIQTSLESLDNPIQNKGQLYKLSIPKDDVMLREGATLAEQPIKVQNALKDIQNEILQSKGYNSLDEINTKLNILNSEYEKLVNKPTLPWESSPTTQIQSQISNLERIRNMFDYGGSHKNIYTNLAKRLGEEETSILLNQHGIKGISYNGGIDGEANVIFNPDDIDIIPYYDNPTSLKEKFINLLNR